MKTKQEDLLVSSERLSYAFENPDVTHVVIGIKWGANVPATFERTVEKSDDVTRIEGALAATFSKPLLSISDVGEVSTRFDNSGPDSLDNLCYRSNRLWWMQNLILNRMVLFLEGFIGQKK